MGGESGCHNQQNTGSNAVPSRDRRVLNLADNPEASSGASEPALLLDSRFKVISLRPIGRLLVEMKMRQGCLIHAAGRVRY